MGGLHYLAMATPQRLLDERLTHSIIGAFYEVYNHFGHGYLESVYAAAMELELTARRHYVAREVSVSVQYRGVDIAWQRLDMIVDGRVIIEIKASEALPRIAERQLLSYLKVTTLEVRLLFHFGLSPRFRRLISSNAFRRSSPEEPQKADASLEIASRAASSRSREKPS
jgi:hypothetical protein